MVTFRTITSFILANVGAEIGGRTPMKSPGGCEYSAARQRHADHIAGGFAGSRNGQIPSDIHQIGGRILKNPDPIAGRVAGGSEALWEGRRDSEIGVEITIGQFFHFQILKF